MRTILLPVDGTIRTDAAVQCVIRQARLGDIGVVHLVNVQPRLGSYIGRFLKAALIRDFQREQGQRALARARRLLDEAGVPYKAHIYTGELAETIARAATTLGVDEIIMSANNLGIIGNLDLHAVVGRVLRRVNIPVSVVNYPANDMAVEASAGPWQLRPTL